MESDFEVIAKIVDDLQGEYVNPNDPWIGSPFAWIRKLPSRTIGAIGEKIVSSWASAEGFSVERTGDSEADRKINGIRVEIKMSTLWTDTGMYKFQQIRDQDYEHCICLGISPHTISAWIIPKQELMTPREGLSHQHGGAAGVDTMWLSVLAEKPHEWLASFGGTLPEVKARLLAADTAR